MWANQKQAEKEEMKKTLRMEKYKTGKKVKIGGVRVSLGGFEFPKT